MAPWRLHCRLLHSGGPRYRGSIGSPDSSGKAIHGSPCPMTVQYECEELSKGSEPGDSGEHSGRGSECPLLPVVLRKRRDDRCRRTAGGLRRSMRSLSDPRGCPQNTSGSQGNRHREKQSGPRRVPSCCCLPEMATGVCQACIRSS